MTTSTKFDNCHVIQYSVNSNGNMDIRWSRPLQYIENRLVPGLFFWGVQASKYGIRQKVQKATHFAIVDLSLPKEEAVIFHREFPEGVTSGSEIYPIRNHFLRIRYSRSHMKLSLSQFRTRNQAIQNKESS